MYETVGITLAELCHECLTREYAGIRSFSGACSYVYTTGSWFSPTICYAKNLTE